MADSSQDPITRLNAALGGRYPIEREIGEGGMATVYLAEDLRHERKVALKVLKPELAAVVGAERFLAEIKTTANLQHPHILPLHDSGEADGFLYYVMPYIEGDTLRDKIDRDKQLSVEDALNITEKVASALDYAHKQGVVHRDIKPGNILLSSTGEPTVADFGIALAVAHAGGGRVTETGLSVGTPHYMSPEQATGDRDVDPRTDVYALGCVLYESLVGEPPYTGSTAQAILGKIIQGGPVSATEARSTVPPNVDAAIRKALEKLPADRFATAEEFAGALADSGFRHREEVWVGEATGQGLWSPLSLALAGLALIASAVAVWSLTRPETPARITRSELTLPDGLRMGGGGGVSLDVGPDGSVVFVGSEVGEPLRLYLRTPDQLEPSPIPGTENAVAPRFSPDGASVAFIAGTSLRTISLEGAPSRTLVSDSMRVPGGIAWGPGGTVYYGLGSGGGIWRVRAGETYAEPVTTLMEGEAGHIHVEALPDGRSLLFTKNIGTPEEDQIAVHSFETGETRELFQGAMARYSHSGHIVYSVGGGSLRAVRFDIDRLEVLGESRALTAVVSVNRGSASQFALNSRGDLVYVPAGGDESGADAWELVWVTRSGNAEPVDPGWQYYGPEGRLALDLSPAGDRVAYTAVGTDGNIGIWTKALPDGVPQLITTEETDEWSPRWTSDGDSVVYLRNDIETQSVWRIPADRSSLPTPLLEGGGSFADSEGGGSFDHALVSPNDEWILLRTGGPPAPSGARDIVGFRPGQDDTVTPLVATSEFMEQGPALSPNGRWLAYQSNETGPNEVHVVSFPDLEIKRQVSESGGRSPLWSNSGTELFFVDDAGDLISVQVETDPEFIQGESQRLFTIGPELGPFVGRPDAYHLSPDDQRFLMPRLADPSAVQDRSRLVWVQNLFEELRQVTGD